MRTRHIISVLGLVALIAGTAAKSGAQDTTTSNPEREARLARRGAALRAGLWGVRNLYEPSGAESSAWPLLEGEFSKGLDRHLALETSVAVWRRQLSIEQSGGIGGGTTRETVTSYVVPMLTTLQIYPFTGPTQHLEPFIGAGAGFALGIDDRETTSGSLLGLGGDSGIQTVLGFALKGATGLEWRPGAFGLTAGGGYQWVRFTQDIGGGRTYAGWMGYGGITYRFQF